MKNIVLGRVCLCERGLPIAHTKQDQLNTQTTRIYSR